jgi:hypothetical protein
MSNHGKESTNKEGVNIDETRTKIDMGKLITSIALELAFKPVAIEPMLPEWILAVHCGVVVLVLFG